MKQREIKVYRELMGENTRWAKETRELLEKKKLLMLNLIGSPGSGKTQLLEATAEALNDRVRLAVLEGDVETTRDAERLAAYAIPVSQLLTDGACHLEAKLVHFALKDLPLENLDLVFIENVGNLVCPAEFDVGEMAKVAVLSVTEGEDKPLKYPLLFREAEAVVITKMDLIPHTPFNLDSCLSFIRQVNATLPVFTLSALNDEGVDPWITWVLKGIPDPQSLSPGQLRPEESDRVTRSVPVLPKKSTCIYKSLGSSSLAIIVR